MSNDRGFHSISKTIDRPIPASILAYAPAAARWGEGPLPSPPAGRSPPRLRAPRTTAARPHPWPCTSPGPEFSRFASRALARMMSGASGGRLVGDCGRVRRPREPPSRRPRARGMLEPPSGGPVRVGWMIGSIEFEILDWIDRDRVVHWVHALRARPVCRLRKSPSIAEAVDSCATHGPAFGQAVDKQL